LNKPSVGEIEARRGASVGPIMPMSAVTRSCSGFLGDCRREGITLGVWRHRGDIGARTVGVVVVMMCRIENKERGRVGAAPDLFAAFGLRNRDTRTDQERALDECHRHRMFLRRVRVC